jgi:hypothetical protein
MSLTPVTINVNGLRDNRKHTHIHIQYIPTHSINTGREAVRVCIVLKTRIGRDAASLYCIGNPYWTKRRVHNTV